MFRHTSSVAVIALMLIGLIIAVIPVPQPAVANDDVADQVAPNSDIVSDDIVSAGSQPPVAQQTFRPVATIRFTIVPMVTRGPFQSPSPSASPSPLPSTTLIAVDDLFYARSAVTSTYVGNVLRGDTTGNGGVLPTYCPTLDVVSSESNDFDVQIDSAGNIYLKEYRPGYWTEYSTTYHLRCRGFIGSPPVPYESVSNEATVHVSIWGPPATPGADPTATAPAATATRQATRIIVFPTVSPRVTPRSTIGLPPIATARPSPRATISLPITRTPTRPPRP